jgi:ferrous iron transport protein B
VPATVQSISKTLPQRYRVALAGNPNCGKTTLFNALTGLRHKVANYPGVTVEKKEGVAELESLGEITVIDLPGIYSLSAHSLDETIASKALLGELQNEEVPDLVIAVVDASNLERNLYLTSQLLDLGIPLIIALNMSDVAEKRGISIKKEVLSRLLDVPVVGITANKKVGIDQLKTEVMRILKTPAPSSQFFGWLSFDSPYRAAAEEIGTLAAKHKNSRSALLLGSALLSESAVSTSPEVLGKLASLREALVKQKIDPFSYEATHRYEWINQIMRKSCSYANEDRKHLSDRLDALIIHKVWGTAIFLLIMTLIFQSIFLWASVPMDLIDGLFSSFSAAVGQHMPPGVLRSLVVDGIIPGVGSVVIFVPQIAILFFFLGALEDSGYLSRAAFSWIKLCAGLGFRAVRLSRF